MARRLLGAGHDLAVWNRTPARAEPLADAGAVVADTPREAAAGADFVITMVTDERALDEVVWSHDGTAAGATFGATMIEMSTVGPAAVCAIRDRLPEDVELIDAPVLGSIPQATEGTLNILVGGDEETFEHSRAILEVLGTPLYLGKLGSGAAMKLVFNSTLGTMMLALGEALVLAEAQGIDVDAALDVLELSHLRSIVAQKRSMIESGEHPASFSLGMEAKDLRLVAEAAERGGVTLEAATLARRVFEGAAAGGYGDDDYSALVSYLLRRS
jgi:3-hydroxyisobutyrate dehydrogenase-like beta-hydroxyacid dehydrogenase